MKTKLRARRAQAMKKHQRSSVGPRCRSFCTGCITCARWHFFDVHGRFPYSYEETEGWNQMLEYTSGDRDGLTWVEARNLPQDYVVFLHQQKTLEIRAAQDYADAYDDWVARGKPRAELHWLK